MNINIMIVDDEISMEKLIKKIFRNEQNKRNEQNEKQYCFSYYNTGEAAYQFLGISRDVDIVLLDINMPGKIDGLTLLEKIHKMNPLIKVIIISAYGDMKRSRIAMQHGAFDFLEKPIDADDLRFIVRRAADYIAESKKAAQLVNQLDLLNYFVKSDVVDLVKYSSVKHAMEDCKKEIATVLMAKVRNYTRYTEEMQPPTLVRMLNDYYTVITRAVDMYNGYIDCYLDNTAVAVFYGTGHITNAVQAGLKIRNSIDKLNQVRAVNKEIILQVSTVICAGEVIAGNIGSEDPIRLTHTIIGTPVNLCFRLQDIAQDNDILFPRNPYTEPFLVNYNCTILEPGKTVTGWEIYKLETKST